jgi:hypothetical protein
MTGNVTTALQAFATTGNGLTLTLRDAPGFIPVVTQVPTDEHGEQVCR